MSVRVRRGVFAAEVDLLILLATGLAEAAGPLVDAVEVEIGDFSTAVTPFSNLAPRGPLHPAATIGVQHRWSDRRFGLVQSARIGGHAHPTAGNAARLSTDLDLRWASRVGPVLEAGLTAGLHHVFRQRPVLVFDPDTGEYTERASRGRPGVAVGAGVAIGVDLDDWSELPLTVLVDYHWVAQTNWLPALPVGPLGTLSVGLRLGLGGDR